MAENAFSGFKEGASIRVGRMRKVQSSFLDKWRNMGKKEVTIEVGYVGVVNAFPAATGVGLAVAGASVAAATGIGLAGLGAANPIPVAAATLAPATASPTPVAAGKAFTTPTYPTSMVTSFFPIFLHLSRKELCTFLIRPTRILAPSLNPLNAFSAMLNSPLFRTFDRLVSRGVAAFPRCAPYTPKVILLQVVFK